jgi:hypothetical protein
MSPYGWCLWCFESKPAPDCSDICSEECRRAIRDHDTVLAGEHEPA